MHGARHKKANCLHKRTFDMRDSVGTSAVIDVKPLFPQTEMLKVSVPNHNSCKDGSHQEFMKQWISFASEIFGSGGIQSEYASDWKSLDPIFGLF